MTASFGWERVADILAEPNIRQLVLDYFEELSPLQGVAVLDPDFARMAACEAEGTFKVWCARSEDGLLIGFVMVWLMSHLNYRSTLFAFDAGHYLDPEFRDSHELVGLKMWRSLVEALRKLEVKVVMAHDNAARPLGPFFKRLGFEARSMMYWRSI